jgi:hypothetical protein
MLKIYTSKPMTTQANKGGILRKSTFLAFIWLIFLGMILQGCGGGGGGGSDAPVPAPSATILGAVTAWEGGPALPESSISAQPGGDDGIPPQSAKSDSQGRYSFSLAEGVYDITASKEGFAASRIQDFKVSGGESYPNANLVQETVFNPDWKVEAPVITSVSGITEGAQVSGSVSIQVKTSSANPMLKIEMRVGNATSIPDASSRNSSTLDFTWDTSLLPPPPSGTFVKITAIDVNHNRVEKYISVKSATGAQSALSAPQNPLSYAYTFPYKYLQYKSDYRDKGDASGSFPLHASTGFAPGSSAGGRAAPAGTTVFVALSWDKVADATGYRVYRKIGQEGEFALLGDTLGADYNRFYDYGPLLTPGQECQYSISPFNGRGEGASAVTPAVAPLGRFALALASPADGETGVSINPDFQWQVTQAAGESQLYQLHVLGYNDGAYTYYGTIRDETRFSGPTLRKNTVYQWDISQAAAMGSWSSQALDYMARSYGEIDGSFIFTTGN